jgi:glyoxylase-like metal-dependent hydrolase (beta-lactamase superfamily II)
MTHELDLHRPGPGVTRFTVPLILGSPDHLHVHVLDTPEGPLVVDTGLKGSEAALHAGLAAAGVTDPRVFITHGHPDHWGIATDIAPEVYAHPDIAQTFMFTHGPGASGATSEFGDPAKFMEAFAEIQAVIGDPPDVIPVSDGDSFGDWTVLHTPGHDPAHVCLYRELDRVLLCGDLLLPGYTPNVQPAWGDTDALQQFLTSLRRVADLPVDLVLPAHGQPYTDAHGRAQELLDHHARRLTGLQQSLHDGTTTLTDLSIATFGSQAESREDRMLALMETYAHLDHLRRNGVASQHPDGTWTAA